MRATRTLLARAAILAATAAGLALGGTGGAGAQGVAPLLAPAAGSYLAARAADRANDFGAASRWFLQALAEDPQNAELVDRCLAALIGLGDFETAEPLALRAVADGTGTQTANIVLMAMAATAGDWAQVTGNLDDGQTVSQLIDGLARAWAAVALDDRTAALAGFDALVADPGTVQFGLYHKALALAVLGDLEGADALFSGAPDNGLPYTRRSIVAHAQILSQLGRPERARTELARFGANVDPAILALREALDRGETLPMTVVTSPTEGLAEGFHNVARLLIDTAPEAYVLLFARVAEHLNPDDAETLMLSGGLLEAVGRYDLAGAAYARVPETDPAFYSAEFSRAAVLRRSGAPEQAVEVLREMLARYPGLAMAHAELADALRALDRTAEAREAYGEAIDLLPETDARLWRMRFLRGVMSEKLGDWPAARDDLRAAYALHPDEPGLLNFLGYAMVERGEDLDEALELIERAMAVEPDNGAIVDSYGWALYRLGRFDEAVAPMETAIRLDPENAVINDHLGDVYWRVGRILEAHFQWQRALSFETDPALLDAIRAKLDGGLAPEPVDAPDETALQDN